MRLSCRCSVAALARRRRWRPATPVATVALVLVLVLALAACAKKDMTTEMDRTRSWTATMKLAGELRGVRATNGAVTTQLLRRAAEAHGKEEQEFARLAKSDSQRAAARGLLDSLQQGIVNLEQLVR